MTMAITHAEPAEFSPKAIRRTRTQCDALQDAGVLTPQFELVDGVINGVSQNVPHGILVRLLLEWLFAAFGARFVLTQVTIDVRPEDNPTNAPMPDAILLFRSAEELTASPIPADIRLCIEASDMTLGYDLTTKAKLYARAGIREYWVIALADRTAYVHRQPQNGVYQDVAAFGELETIAPIGALETSVLVGQLLPRPPKSDQ